jgi:hypothetical protein
VKTIEIEVWTLRILETVEKGVRVEDATVELKATWPDDPMKAARRLAGHANAARGENILWLIGVDEQRGIVEASYQELSNWFASIQSAFDGIAPALQDLNIPYKGKTVAALCFDTSRAPYVVKNHTFGSATGGPVEWEVPWHEGTKTRSATRSDLILLLSPVGKIPKFELLAGTVALRRDPKSAGKASWTVDLQIYVTLLDGSPLVYPFHKCAAAIGAKGVALADSFRIDVRPASRKRPERGWASWRASMSKNPVTHVNVKTGDEIIEATNDEILIRGTGKIELHGFCDVSSISADEWPGLQLRITLHEAVTESKVALVCQFSRPRLHEGVTIWWLDKSAPCNSV